MKRPADPGPVLWGVGLGTGLSLLGDSAMYTVLPTHTAEAGILLASVGLMLSANRFIRLVLNGPIGWLCDHWPRRRVFLPALFLGALSTALYAAASGYWPLLAARLLWGVSWSGIWVAGNAIILDISWPANRGRLVGFYNIAFFAGAAAGAVLGGWLTDLVGYRGAFATAAALSLLGAIAAWRLLPETSGAKRRVSHFSQPPSLQPLNRRRPWGQIISAVGLMAVNRLAIPGILMATFGRYLLETFGEEIVLAGRSLGVATLTGLGLGSMTVLSMVSVWAAGQLSDRLTNRWQMAAAGLLPGAAGFGLLLWAAPWAALVGLPLAAIASGSNQVLATTIIGDLVEAGEEGRFLGLLFTIGDLCSAIGPLLAFWLLAWVSVSWLYGGTGLLFGGMLLVAGSWAVRGQGEIAGGGRCPLL